MQSAISIPERFFESAEQFARGRGTSRSELYTMALRHYLEEHRGGMITERLDEINGGKSGGLDPGIARLQAWSLPEHDW